jgi:hypothetical protein
VSLELHTIVYNGVFEGKAGHEYNPNYLPARKKSASEQCTARKQAHLAAQLTVGQKKLQSNSFQKAQNDMRVPHRLQYRTKADSTAIGCEKHIEEDQRSKQECMI